MQLLVLGAGCPMCDELYTLTDQAARQLGIEYSLKKVRNLKEIMSYGMPLTPVLVIDGHVKVVGEVPSLDEIKAILREAGA